MGATQNLPLYLKKGEDYSVSFFLREKKSRDAVDISSYSFKGDIKKNASDDDSEIIGSFTYSAPFQAVDPSDGVTKWFVTRSISSNDIAIMIDLGINCAVSDMFGSPDGGTTWSKWRKMAIKFEGKITVLS